MDLKNPLLSSELGGPLLVALTKVLFPVWSYWNCVVYDVSALMWVLLLAEHLLRNILRADEVAKAPEGQETPFQIVPPPIEACVGFLDSLVNHVCLRGIVDSGRATGEYYWFAFRGP